MGFFIPILHLRKERKRCDSEESLVGLLFFAMLSKPLKKCLKFTYDKSCDAKFKTNELVIVIDIRALVKIIILGDYRMLLVSDVDNN